MSTPVHGVVMRRFGVFGGPCYYPLGGFHDFKRSFGTLAEALAFAESERQIYADNPNIREPENEWWHVFDFESRTVVKISEGDGFPKLDGLRE
jgi:hypothetical protein